MVVVKISISDIIKYVGDKMRPIVEGDAVYNAGHVLLCQIKDLNGPEIFGLVIQTSSLTSKPHEVRLLLNGSADRWQCICSCKAGQSGFCKHVIGTLLYINNKEDLEELACTSLTQVWGKEKGSVKKKYEAKSTEEFYHRSNKHLESKVFSYTTSESLDQKNFKILTNCELSGILISQRKKKLLLDTKLSAVSKFLSRAKEHELNEERLYLFLDIIQTTVHSLLQSFSVCCCFCCRLSCRLLKDTSKTKNAELIFQKILKHAGESYVNKMTLNNYNLENCCEALLNTLKHDNKFNAISQVIQGSEHWKTLRQLRITGSRIYSLCTYSKDDWHKKALNYFFPKEFTSVYTEHGKKYEPIAFAKYRELHPNYAVHSTGIICEKYPWMAYSPDGIIFENKEPVKLLEIKCPYSGKTFPADELPVHCSYLEQFDGKWVLKKNHSYYAQIQYGMALTNLGKADFILYSSLSNSIFKIETLLDESYAQRLITKANYNFINNMIHVFCTNKNS